VEGRRIKESESVKKKKNWTIGVVAWAGIGVYNVAPDQR
jgi:hypothetical protein